ncbi:MAG: carbamoyl-phosphate synthase small subunit [Halothiobacillus sp. 24-54-40]|nr:MAG: carbamoyl-phosphate synthase small subunit [Halothiobacillus sp. 35-54-62]OYZ87982.1 MAG: carbamoyl-phosphate synthase small subunit [Halothiobacillus sp. 24-54-40]OZA81400.1 MAG: carbamoyl-phosphate synthase small subunit [Halothiobacillus sp. 39-53-45]HQS02192.1 glutamine-hydrolyzing carbamoyl-phosphate synthase small subunit [Halothiobacillus sp.]HQS29002.1 glutamine-hydrolyzing carbamoyl-phosphate synthase small subunit [Halothiobacillus sp.]
MKHTALLALADGSLFYGTSIGASGSTVGEVVFNTAMTGYQEILTDPSYRRQIVTLTYPHIGNVGVNSDDAESLAVHAAGLVIRDASAIVSNWRAQESLGDYCVRNQLVAIADLDTRALTRILRDTGAQNGCIQTGDALDAEAALAAARAFAGLDGMDLVPEVTTATPIEWTQGTWQLDPATAPVCPTLTRHVVAWDYGMKHNILRLLVDRGCKITLLPATTPASAVLALNPDGILLGNGPGDPAACHYAIEAIAEVLTHDIPIFGICLGHQLLALASGAKTVKMKFGHHGANHPVQNMASGKVFISSQNHGFAVDEATLPSQLKATHRSLFDGSLQGIARTDRVAFSFQGHPEASPGPHDLDGLFDQFVAAMDAHRAAKPL